MLVAGFSGMAQNPANMRRQRLLQILLLSVLVAAVLAFQLLCWILYDTHGRFVSRDRWRGDEAGTNWNADQNIIWFVQVTDIHINVHSHSDITADFELFCGDFLQKVIRPAAVFVTGKFFKKYDFF